MSEPDGECSIHLEKEEKEEKEALVTTRRKKKSVPEQSLTVSWVAIFHDAGEGLLAQNFACMNLSPDNSDTLLY